MELNFNEEWKNVEGYESLYQVSSLGRVKSLEKHFLRKYREGYRKQTIPEKILKPFPTRTAYLLVKLTKNKIEKCFQVHRLVAMAFIPNPQNKPQVNHINGNKTDNKVENLEWVTQTENIRRAYATGLQNHETAVRVTTPDNKVHEFRNQRLASQFLKISPSRLNETLKSNTGKKCAGCKVEYVNKD